MILSNLNNIKTFPKMSQTPARPKQIEMTVEQLKRIAVKLKDEFRVNVYPNKFDVAKPYQVSVKKNNQFTNYGSFVDLEVASLVGTIAGIVTFKDKALIGDYDQEKAQVHPEFLAWTEDPRNSATVSAFNTFNS